MNALFLDIDGVLNSEAFLRKLDTQHQALGHHEHCECYRLEHQIDRDAITRLNRLIAETDSKIVISSSWRLLLDPPELQRVLTEHGLVAEIIGATPDGPNDPEMLAAFGHIDRIFRGNEIDFWLKKHPEIERFVILDDSSDMGPHKNRHVQTDCEEGLLDEHVDWAIRMMSWDGKTLPSPMDEAEPDDDHPGSSWGVHCHHNSWRSVQEACPETLVLARTTTVPPTHEDDYQRLAPALHEAAVFLGWRLYQGVFWCPTHVLAKKLACARCLNPCPECSCMGGPLGDAVDGMPEDP